MTASFLPTPDVRTAVIQKYNQAILGDYRNGEGLDEEEFRRLCACFNHIYGQKEVTKEVTRFLVITADLRGKPTTEH